MTSIEQLKRLSTAERYDGEALYHSGYRTPGDGGGAIRYWDADSNDEDNGGSCVAPSSGAIGRYRTDTGTQISVKQFGARGDGTTDDTARIQAAVDAGFAKVYVPSGTYITTSTIYLKSGQTLYGDGSRSIIKASATWLEVGEGEGGTGKRYMLVSNENFDADTITDEDITVRDLSFSYENQVYVSGGGTHAIRFRKAAWVTVENCSFFGGNNGTAFLACENTLVHACKATGIENCAFDHWEGSVGCKVSDCVAIANANGGAQGIMFTGTGTLGEDLDAYDFICTGCRVKGFSGAGKTGILVNAQDADSSSVSFSIGDNIVRDCGIGIAVTGEAGTGVIGDNVLVNIGTGPAIFIKTENSDTPDDIVVKGNVIKGCTTNAANVAAVSCTGSNHVVMGNLISGTMPYGVRLSGDGQIAIGNAIVGATDGRFNLTGATNSHVLDTKPGGGVGFPGVVDDPAGAVQGDVVWNYTLDKLRVYNGVAWESLH